MAEIINISSYRFVNIAEDRLPELRASLRSRTRAAGMKGTILLSPEGINLFVAGTREQIELLRSMLDETEEFRGLDFKESPSTDQPFTRMLVKIKKEIIAFGQDSVDPLKHVAPYITPQELAEMYAENEDMIVLDTRNDYEIQLGTFDDAVGLDIKNFRDFPAALANAGLDKSKTVVTFCTGGIRCEKAAEFMLQQGFKDVRQLEGGILRYFEHIGQDHYHGECFVFDKRVAVNHELNETATVQCYECRSPITAEQQREFQGQCPYPEKHHETA